MSREFLGGGNQGRFLPGSNPSCNQGFNFVLLSPKKDGKIVSGTGAPVTKNLATDGERERERTSSVFAPAGY
jgi:hypothetical protein